MPELKNKHKTFPKYRYFIKNILLDLTQESKVSSIDMAKKVYIPLFYISLPPPLFFKNLLSIHHYKDENGFYKQCIVFRPGKI